jgi:hypothetical protein
MENLPQNSSLDIPLLKGFAGSEILPGGVIWQRLERRYARLCFVQEELTRLNALKAGEKKLAKPSESFEDFVFSKTDFSRYKRIARGDFVFFTASLDDFDKHFFVNNFKKTKIEVEKLLQKCYKEIGPYYCLLRESPLILSIMRTLETSLDSLPLINEEEIIDELKLLSLFQNSVSFGQALGKTGQEPGFFIKSKGAVPKAEVLEQPLLYSFLGGGLFKAYNIHGFFGFLLQRLDGVKVTQKDGSITTLFIDTRGDLSGVFTPDNKKWTLKLAPCLNLTSSSGV